MPNHHKRKKKLFPLPNKACALRVRSGANSRRRLLLCLCKRINSLPREKNRWKSIAKCINSIEGRRERKHSTENPSENFVKAESCRGREFGGWWLNRARRLGEGKHFHAFHKTRTLCFLTVSEFPSRSGNNGATPPRIHPHAPNRDRRESSEWTR